MIFDGSVDRAAQLGRLLAATCVWIGPAQKITLSTSLTMSGFRQTIACFNLILRARRRRCRWGLTTGAIARKLKSCCSRAPRCAPSASCGGSSRSEGWVWCWLLIGSPPMAPLTVRSTSPRPATCTQPAVTTTIMVRVAITPVTPAAPGRAAPAVPATARAQARLATTRVARCGDMPLAPRILSSRRS